MLSKKLSVYTIYKYFFTNAKKSKNKQINNYLDILQ